MCLRESDNLSLWTQTLPLLASGSLSPCQLEPRPNVLWLDVTKFNFSDEETYIEHALKQYNLHQSALVFGDPVKVQMGKRIGSSNEQLRNSANQTFAFW